MSFWDVFFGPPSEKKLNKILTALLEKRKLLFSRIRNLRRELGSEADSLRLPREMLESNIQEWRRVGDIPHLRANNTAFEIAKLLEEYAEVRQQIRETISEMRAANYNPSPVLEQHEHGLEKALAR